MNGYGEIKTKILPNEIQEGDFIRFRVEPWFARREGLARFFKDENDGINQGFVSVVTPKSVIIPFCKIHERRDKQIPKSVFVYVFRIENKMRRDWVKESRETME